MDIQTLTSSTETGSRLGAPTISESSVTIQRSVFGAMIDLHRDLGRGVLRMTQLAEQAEANPHSDPALDRIWRALAIGAPERFTQYPKSGNGLVRTGDPESPIIWSANIVFDRNWSPFVIGLDAHDCRHAAGLVAHVTKCTGQDASTIRPLIRAFREWLAYEDGLREISHAVRVPETAGPIHGALARAFARAGLGSSGGEDRPIASFNLPLGCELTETDEELLQRCDHGTLIPFVPPNWPASCLGALALLRNDAGDAEVERVLRVRFGEDELKRIRAHIPETYLLNDPAAIAKMPAHPATSFFLRRASAFSDQRIFDRRFTKARAAAIANDMPYSAVLQRRIEPRTINGAPFSVQTLARGGDLLCFAATSLVPPNGSPAHLAYHDVYIA